jgi:hypothetical protein
MANRPANAGSGSVGLGRGLAPMGDVAPPLDTAAPPPPVHHVAVPHAAVPRTGAPRAPAGHRAKPGPSGLAWLPYLIVLAGAAAGMFVAWQGSKYAGRGTGLVGCSLLAAALARLTLPARYAGLLASRRKASDVLAFAVFGAAVLAVALTLP